MDVGGRGCGRLGKKENCQVAVYAGYASPKGHSLVDHQLYLPEEWCDDPERRAKCHVPPSVRFQKAWEIAASMIDALGDELPHAWIAGDDEFGRVGAFRARLRERGENYVVDVPCDTRVRVLDAAGDGGSFQRADDWAKRLPPSAWTKVHVRDGEKGPLFVDAVRAEVQTRLAPLPPTLTSRTRCSRRPGQ